MKTRRPLLKEGDIIILKRGMKVYTELPEKFVYSNRSFSSKLVSTDIVVGNTLSISFEEISKDIELAVSGVLEAMRNAGSKVSKDVCRKFVRSNIMPPEQDFYTFRGGEFLVIRTSYGGGGSSLGMSGYESYPDGHRVYCQRLENGNPVEEFCNFYQTGCFTAMIEDIVPVGKMRKTVNWSKE